MTILDTPTSQEKPKQKWMTPKKWVLAFIIVILLASLGLDAQAKSTINQKAADFHSFAVTLKYEVQTCNGPRSQGAQAYHQALLGHMAASTAINILTTAEAQCTPVGNNNLYNMDTTTIPGNLSNLHLAKAINYMNSWTFLSAAASLIDMKNIIINHHNTLAIQDLKNKEQQMKIQSKQAQLILNQAAKKVHGTNVNLNIP